MRKLLAAIAIIMALGASLAQTDDQEMLGKAIEYFQGGKFHESLLLFQKLDNKYRLNPRLRAFMAVCYFYEWEDKKVTQLLDSLLPQLEPFAPHEKSIYYFINAESHFNLGEYDKAIPCYEQMTGVCYPNEKSDAYYRMGYSYMQQGDYATAYEYMVSARAYMKRYRTAAADRPRLAQVERMANGLRQHANIEYYSEPQLADSSLADTQPSVTPATPPAGIPVEDEVIRDTIKSRIIKDINLYDIYQHETIINP